MYRLALLVAALRLGPARAQICSPKGKECTRTGCCAGDFESCYQKNENVSFCRRDCKPGIHGDDPPQYQTRWSCKLVTWGCNTAWKGCEGAKGQKDVIPCCQEGCICNYTKKFFHQCLPPSGQAECGKDGPQKRPDFSKLDAAKKKEEAKEEDEEEEEEEDSTEETKSSKDTEEAEEEDEEEEEPADESGEKLPPNCMRIGGALMGSGCKKKTDVVSDAESVHVSLPHAPSMASVVGVAAASTACAAVGMMLWRGSRRANGRVSVDVERLSEEEESS